jgi:hypothetical protein
MIPADLAERLAAALARVLLADVQAQSESAPTPEGSRR